jgi:glycosyltransferase involved in cell wall biosynthesis
VNEINSQSASPHQLRCLVFGVADMGQPRNQTLLKSLAAAGCRCDLLTFDPWGNIPYKLNMKVPDLVRLLWRIVRGYGAIVPALFIRSRDCDFILVGYPGYGDVVLAKIAAGMHRKTLVYDPFISLYDTIIDARKLLPDMWLFRWLFKAIDRAGCEMGDLVLFDTVGHSQYFTSALGVRNRSRLIVYIGYEPEWFLPGPQPPAAPDRPFRVLYFGKFAPLHGLEFVITAAKQLEPDGVEFILCGTGQRRDTIVRQAAELGVANITWKEWIEHESLQADIRRADLCLGLFGISDKGDRVIPYKIFECAACGKPVITRQSLAVAEVFTDREDIIFVPPGDAGALADGIRWAKGQGEILPRIGNNAAALIRDRFSYQRQGSALADSIRNTMHTRDRVTADRIWA